MSESGDGPLVALRSGTGIALIAATVLASMVAAIDANVIKVAIPAIGRDLGAGVGGGPTSEPDRTLRRFG